MISINYAAQSHSKEMARDWSFLNQIEVNEVDNSCDGFGVYMISFRYRKADYMLTLAQTDNSEVTNLDGDDVPAELHKLSDVSAWEAGESSLYVTLTNGDDIVFKNIKWSDTDEETDE